ncbi:hypothetical protein jhhlp_001726 [Lomentospora prolificans]|uniref:Beta-galactosidase n=1 Tax=Lomentospora prolificans TaxID=41688 RepID=A0A2N3NH34_9PEZI|nr:hypothetical protein jhhlp_001726 [Lomentospora prolificans]
MERKSIAMLVFNLLLLALTHSASALVPRRPHDDHSASRRERVSINNGWRFSRSVSSPDKVVYEPRPDLDVGRDVQTLKPWILPLANDFINDPANHYEVPAEDPVGDIPFTLGDFDDSDWEEVNVPHDWAIQGPFYTEQDPIVGGGMGRLPIHGVGWYRQKLTVTPADEGKTIYLDVDGAMSYPLVWLNGHLVGGWPYGYNSFRLELTPHLKLGKDNQVAIRVDNPTDSSRWYPGGGIYRNVWLTKVDPIHVAQWGTYITSTDVSEESATIDLILTLENKGPKEGEVEVVVEVHEIDDGRVGEEVARFPTQTVTVELDQKTTLNLSTTVENPKLWGPPPTQEPNLYVAVVRVFKGKEELDTYETRFGIRAVVFSGDDGLIINGERIQIRGVNQHHDLGALGAAFNVRAAQRQLEVLRDLGSNAIRMAHNPPATELLELTDEMGFLVIDEIFDCWEREKNPSDFHLIFKEWHEADLRSFMRRDRIHVSVIAWSIGNEVGEQYTEEAGAALADSLRKIAHEEDPTRPATASMNYAKPDMPFPGSLDIISLNYQGEGIRDAPAYSHLQGIKTSPLYQAFHDKFPDKLIFGSETAAALSTRGTYLFPVTNETSAPVADGSGGDPIAEQVSAYELYTAPFGSSADKVFSAQDHHPFVAGEFVWSGWDYLGEPTPYYTARSSFFGIIDLAGFPKDRYFLYQSRWRPDLPFAHILPHWTWPDREGQVTPVHVFSTGDEAELFVNGESQGRLQKEEYTYRFRWDDVVYQPGEVNVVVYKNGEEWAEASVQTAGEAARFDISVDRDIIATDGLDLAFIAVKVVDDEGVMVPGANNEITFGVSGAGELVATDNGDPADMTSFPSATRKAYNGLALGIVKAKPGSKGPITVTVTADGISDAEITINE